MSVIVKRVLGALIGIVLVGGTIVWLSGGIGERIAPGEVAEKAAELPAGARIAVASERSQPAFEWTNGSLVSARRTAIAARVLATIEEVRVRAGDEVNKNEILIVLDSREFNARVRQTRQALAAAEAQRDLARIEKNRIEKLFKRQVASRERLDQAISDLRVAEAEARRLQDSLREAETALSYTQIRSPMDGRVIDRLAEPGDTAVPGRPLLRIYDPDALRIEVPVRESLAVGRKVGEAIAVQLPAVGATFDGTIDEIVPFAEPGARTLLVKIRLPPDARLFEGMFGRAAIPAGRRTRVLAPAAAVERVGQLAFVTVLGADGRARRRVVTTGDYDRAGLIEVLSGLAKGERVLIKSGGEAERG